MKLGESVLAGFALAFVLLFSTKYAYAEKIYFERNAECRVVKNELGWATGYKSVGPSTPIVEEGKIQFVESWYNREKDVVVSVRCGFGDLMSTGDEYWMIKETIAEWQLRIQNTKKWQELERQKEALKRERFLSKYGL